MKRFKKITSMVLTVLIAASAIMTVGAEKVDENDMTISPVVLCTHASTDTASSPRTWVNRTTHPLYNAGGKIVAACVVETYHTYDYIICKSTCKEIIKTTVRVTYEHSICQ